MLVILPARLSAHTSISSYTCGLAAALEWRARASCEARSTLDGPWKVIPFLSILSFLSFFFCLSCHSCHSFFCLSCHSCKYLIFGSRSPSTSRSSFSSLFRPFSWLLSFRNPRCSAPRCSAPRCAAPHCSTPHCLASRCSASRCSTPRCSAPCYPDTPKPTRMLQFSPDRVTVPEWRPSKEHFGTLRNQNCFCTKRSPPCCPYSCCNP